MITNTHIIFSRILYENCLKSLNFKLNKHRFMYGNIKPDIFCNHLKDNHTLDGSIELVAEYSKRLMECKFDISRFSVDLGVICHYVCDYFCIYHTNKYAGRNIFQHISYERKLHNNLLDMLKEQKIEVKSNSSLYEKDIVKFIYCMQEKYFNEKESVAKDITYALKTANTVTQAIVYNSPLKILEYSASDKAVNNLGKIS